MTTKFQGGLACWVAMLLSARSTIDAFSFHDKPPRWSPARQTRHLSLESYLGFYSSDTHRCHPSLLGRRRHRVYASDGSDSSTESTKEDATLNLSPSTSETLVVGATWYLVWLVLAFGATSPPLPLNWKLFWIGAGAWNLVLAASMYARPLLLRIPVEDRPSASQLVGLAGLTYASMAIPEVEPFLRPLILLLALVKVGIIPWAYSNGFLITTTNIKNGDKTASPNLQVIWCLVGFGDALFGLYFWKYFQFAALQ